MSADAQRDGSLPILHHYDFSPFAEKIRLALGIKGLRWHSVIAPSVLPKPDLVALTGGYRHIPCAAVWRRHLLRYADHRSRARPPPSRTRHR